jgi:transposase InsO family protein
VYQFGIPQMLTMNQGAAFMSSQFKEFATSLKIKLLNSSPYYTQANGQTEASNKTIVGLIKKKIEERPRRWHEVLMEALWACRVSNHGATKVTPFELVYGQEAMLSLGINLQSGRVMYQDSLSAKDYRNQLMDRLDELPESRFEALRELEKEKLRVAKMYNKRVKEKSFKVGNLVWKMILLGGS